MLELADLSGNARPGIRPVRCGVGAVRQGDEGSPPRRRTVLTTMGWAAEALAEWVEQIRRDYGPVGPALWPTERGARISTDHINLRFAAYRDAVGLPVELGPHCLRHSFTHLLEDGFDHLFVQQPAGHSWGRPPRCTQRSAATTRTGRCAVPWTVHSQTRPGISG